jgi:hypothetical protein
MRSAKILNAELASSNGNGRHKTGPVDGVHSAHQPDSLSANCDAKDDQRDDRELGRQPRHIKKAGSQDSGLGDETQDNSIQANVAKSSLMTGPNEKDKFRSRAIDFGEWSRTCDLTLPSIDHRYAAHESTAQHARRIRSTKPILESIAAVSDTEIFNSKLKICRLLHDDDTLLVSERMEPMYSLSDICGVINRMGVPLILCHQKTLLPSTEQLATSRFEPVPVTSLMEQMPWIEYFSSTSLSCSPHLLVMPPVTEEALPSNTPHTLLRPPIAGNTLENPWLLDGDFASLNSTRHLITSHMQSEPGDVNAVSGITKLDNKLQALWLFLDFYGIPFAALTVCLRLDFFLF